MRLRAVTRTPRCSIARKKKLPRKTSALSCGGILNVTAVPRRDHPSPQPLRHSELTSCLLLALGLQPFLLDFGARSSSKPRATRSECRSDVATITAILQRCDIDSDRIADLDHVVAVAGAIHVVGAVTCEFDVALALLVLDAQDELHVRVDGDELLDDAGNGLGVGEVELNRRMMRG